MTINAVLFIMAVVFAIIEALTPGFFALSISAGLVVAALVAFVTHSVPILILSFAVGMCVFFFALRPLLMKGRSEQTASDALIGKIVLITQDVDNIHDTGRGMVQGMDWRVRSSDDAVTISSGVEAVVLRIEGVTLVVRRVGE